MQALGYRPADVRDIVVTHLDLDHAGGLGDFPHARVHVHTDELAAARSRSHPKEKGRYIAAQWAHGPDWVEHTASGGDGWFGFEAVQAVGEDVLLVPLRGHTRGHSGGRRTTPFRRLVPACRRRLLLPRREGAAGVLSVGPAGLPDAGADGQEGPARQPGPAP